MKKMIAETYAIVNQKGGVGKTTTTYNSAAAARRMGKKVLVMDIDPQGHLTKYSNVTHERGKTISALLSTLIDRKPLPDLSDYIVHHSDFDIIPSDISLAIADTSIVNATSREYLLRKIINTIKDQYDYNLILIDCPPTLGMLMTNILTASDKLIVPIEASMMGVDGFDMLLDVIQLVQEETNPRLEVAGMLITKFIKGEIESRKVVEDLQPYMNKGIKLLNTRIPNGTIAKKGYRERRAIDQIDSKSPLAESYRRLAEEVFND